jgi:Protein of unknown function (DUF2630)
MADEQISDHIEALVKEEHALLDQGGEQGGLDEAGHKRLEQIKVELDRYWDLLRRRKARREFGQDDADVTLRDADTVEGYEG